MRTGEFTAVNALSTLLGTESLLFAAFSLAANMANAPGRARQWVVSGRALAGSAVAGLAFVACGAVTAWAQIFTGGRFQGPATAIVAAAVFVAIVGQPVFALLIALGLRKKP